ncbi:hypothetical protein PRZ48_012622 [Zasmidium cellare]|uniref:Transcription factor domain-containing protein n=1 Tax=Zasmidium cellare TaxID=395010 RepID=A0ABR0E5D5_ZASCE|nr:hypothetical protein PRZ48_012622 [Zasmidium cellare]
MHFMCQKEGPTKGHRKHEAVLDSHQTTFEPPDAKVVSDYDLEPLDDFAMILSKSTDFPDFTETKLKDQPFIWNDLDITFASFMNDEMAGPQPPFQHSVAEQSSIPRAPTPNARSMIARPRIDNKSQRTVKLIMRTLKSYLRMMQQDNTLPPFIHPGLATAHVGHGRMEPMANCMSLMRMLNSEVRGSNKLFWKNVQLESERLLAECATMTRLELLAAMQALSIYIFVRLDEGETNDNDLDEMLQATVTKIAQLFNCQAYTPDRHTQPTELVSMWQQWVIKESINRLCLIYRIIDMLAYFTPAALCDLPSELLLAPLPARKQLWDSPDEFSWSMESSKDLMGPSAFGLTAKGDLLRLSGRELHGAGVVSGEGVGGDDANWEEWCSGMDGLGALVMLAASLVG